MTRDVRRGCDAARRRGRFSTLIRHAATGATTTTVSPLAVPMIQSTLGTPLMPAVRRPQLAPALVAPTRQAAVGLAAVARATDPERRSTTHGAATSLNEGSFRPLRHPVPHAGLDNGGRSWQPEHALVWGPDLSIGGLRQTPVVAIDRGLFYPPAEAPTLTDSIPAPRSRGADDEDLSLPFLGEKSRKLRFLRSVHRGTPNDGGPELRRLGLRSRTASLLAL